jgi:hypothetical protein
VSPLDSAAQRTVARDPIGRRRVAGWLTRGNRPPTHRQLAVLLAVAGTLAVSLVPCMFVCIAHASRTDVDVRPSPVVGPTVTEWRDRP